MAIDQQAARCERFSELHRRGPFLLGNAWDAGSARLLESLGYPAIATTSSGSALRVGRLDYQIDLATSINIAAELAAAVDVPVSVDFEDGFGSSPAEVAASVEQLRATGVAGYSIEDYTRNNADPIYAVDEAAARVAAAAEVASAGPARLVLTARTEMLTNRGPEISREDALPQVIDRLQRYQAAGADVLFAPGLRSPDEITQVVEAVDLPVSIMALPGIPSVAELGELGVARVSVAAWFAYAAMNAAWSAATEVIEHGTFDFLGGLGDVRQYIATTFGT